MSEKEDRARHRLRTPSSQTTEVVVDDSGTLPSYSNFCRVTATPEEVILDFGLNPQPFATGRQDVKANQRIVMNFYTAKRLLTALGMTIQRHEGTFGSIELDVRRRALQPAPGLSPARPGRPPGRRRVIRTRPTVPARDLRRHSASIGRSARRLRRAGHGRPTRFPRRLLHRKPTIRMEAARATAPPPVSSHGLPIGSRPSASPDRRRSDRALP